MTGWDLYRDAWSTYHRATTEQDPYLMAQAQFLATMALLSVAVDSMDTRQNTQWREQKAWREAMGQ